jgi:hypothetical protein
MVDAADYSFWKSHFGMTVGSGSGVGGGCAGAQFDGLAAAGGCLVLGSFVAHVCRQQVVMAVLVTWGC